jgi:energy-coupling factor transporter ATP-binding protein EcfA2
MPLSAVWAGPAGNAHLDGPPLLVAQTAGSTPFRFSTHVGDVGHMMVVGPTGAGKSVLLALLALQFRRYPGAQVYIFDKGFSARAAVLAMGGVHHAMGGGDGGEALASSRCARSTCPRSAAGQPNGSRRCSMPKRSQSRRRSRTRSGRRSTAWRPRPRRSGP